MKDNLQFKKSEQFYCDNVSDEIQVHNADVYLWSENIINQIFLKLQSDKKAGVACAMMQIGETAS